MDDIFLATSEFFYVNSQFTRPGILVIFSRHFILVSAKLLMTCSAVLAFQPLSAFADDLSFNRDIRPILSDNCFQCHGPDSGQRKADLRLDIREEAIDFLSPDDATQSEVLSRILETDKELKMPPHDSQRELKPAEIALLKKWIQQGAQYEQHWSFQKVKSPKIPAMDDKWIQNEIDQFVLARLKQNGMEPSAKASKEILIRRVTLDLTGLPPSLDAIDRFLNDSTPNAFEKVVDRLLKSKSYAEHMTRYWLDLARYADSNGYQYDTERTQWPWRDWVIQAYLENKPFDEFTIEQLAGDLLPDATPSQKLATGFNRNHGITIEGGVIDEEYRTEYVVDRVNTTSAVWLGLTFGCARCHDHKYDPISQKEFYQFFAFFNQVPERGLNGFAPRMAAPLVLQNSEIEQLKASATLTEKEYRKAYQAVRDEFDLWRVKAQRQLPYQWEIIDSFATIESTGGATLKAQSDGSYLATGKNPKFDDYVAQFQPKTKTVSAIRLEVLTDPSFAQPYAFARSSNGNFVMTDFVVDVDQDGTGKYEEILVSSAKADHSQNGYPIGNTIDKAAKTGWASAGGNKTHRQAIYALDAPIKVSEKTQIRIRIENKSPFEYHNIGRFRISVCQTKNPKLYTQEQLALSLPAKSVSKIQNQKIEEGLIKRFGSQRLRYLQNQFVESSRRLKELTVASVQSMVMQDMPKMRSTFTLNRGQYDQKGEEVLANVPEVLGKLPESKSQNRLELARWLVSEKNPLTARVTVNRYWQRYFQNGLVNTPEDFGIQGEYPSHPELLDWLAKKFMNSNWDIRAMQKLIVMSATYQQTSAITNQNNASKDPQNRLLSRASRYRMDAEVIRDQALFSSGLLVDRLGGPSVYPYHPKGLWLEINNRPNYSKAYPQDTGEKLYRRSLYTYWKRTVPPPSMATFDAPEREYCIVKRSTTNTPLQSFVMLHDPQFVEAARQLAAKIMLDPNIKNASTEAKIRFAFRTVLTRQPKGKELKVLQNTFESRKKLYQVSPEKAKKILAVGDSINPELDPVEQAAWTTVARILMNLSESLTRE